MSPRLSSLARTYERVLRALAPSLSHAYARDAARTFQASYVDAREEGAGSLLCFLYTELLSLVGTGIRELRSRGGGEKGPDHGAARGFGSGGGGGFLDGLRQDLRHGSRNLLRAPGFTVVAVLSLTLGIGVSTVLFSVANAALFRPLPHARSPEDLIRIFAGYGAPSRLPISFPEFLDLKEATEGVMEVAVARNRAFYVGPASEASRSVVGEQVSENYFDVLGISMALGRGFLPEDVDRGGAVAVIGHNLWMRRFDGDPGALGQELLVNGRPHVIVGIAPEGMVGLGSPLLLEVVTPVMDGRDDRGHLAFTGVARLEEGTSKARMQAELDAFSVHMAELHPEHWIREGGAARGLIALTTREAMMVDDSTFWVAVMGFLAMVGLILLITCSNVANLLLTRANRRRAEMAVRSAIGARSRRLLAQLLTENLILFGLAGLTTLGLIYLMAWGVQTGGQHLLPAGANFAPDRSVVLFLFGLTAMAGLTFGLLPALQGSRPELISALKGRSCPSRIRWFGVRNLLVGVQVGGSVVFVMGTLLLFQSLSHVRKMDLGFRSEGVAVLSIDLSHGGYGEEDGRLLLRNLQERLRSLPDVEAAEVSTWVPLEGGSTLLGGLEPEGYRARPEEPVMAGMTVVSPGYLDLLDIDLLRGRPLGEGERAESELVGLASKAFLDRYWPGEDGVGKYIGRGDQRPIRVVGIVEDVPMRSLADEPSPHLWLPMSQWYEEDVAVHVRTSGNVRALLPVLRRQVAELDPDLPVLKADLMENITANGTRPQRVLFFIMGLAGAVALALSMLGIYGVVSFSVSQRTWEVGLRIALGAKPERVARQVVLEGFGVASMGLVGGLLLSLAGGQVLRSLLLGVNPINPLALTGGLGLLGVSVLVATLAPALRAAGAEPMEALREE